MRVPTATGSTATSPVIGDRSAAHIAEDARATALKAGHVTGAEHDTIVVSRSMIGEGVAGAWGAAEARDPDAHRPAGEDPALDSPRPDL